VYVAHTPGIDGTGSHARKEKAYKPAKSLIAATRLSATYACHTWRHPTATAGISRSNALLEALLVTTGQQKPDTKR
jgi:hypothetical protein